MTLQADRLRAEVGIRELHDRLSQYVQHVADGAEVVVIVRGRRVARLTPVRDADPLEQLRSRGLVRPALRPKRHLTPADLLPASGTISDLVAEQRR
ncbi:MAG: type II toxin-antitoxin system prevent-host-death family antitoxin [Candidatus Dormibacteraceae bacterium]